MWEIFKEEWLHGTIATLMGLVCGLWVITRYRTKDFGDDLDATLADLEEAVEHAISQLRDLEQHKHLLAASVYDEQKIEFERRAGQAMQELEEKQKKAEQEKKMQKTKNKTSKKEDEASGFLGFLAARPQLKGFLWGGVLVTAIFLLWRLVEQEQKPREDPMPQASNEASSNPHTGDSELMEWISKLKENPKDLDTMAKLVKRLLRTQMFKEAAILIERARAIDSERVDFQVYEAVLTSAKGDQEGAEQALDALVSAYPDAEDAWFFRGMLAMQSGKAERMQESFERYVDIAPDGPKKERIKRMLAGGGIQMPQN